MVNGDAKKNIAMGETTIAVAVNGNLKRFVSRASRALADYPRVHGMLRRLYLGLPRALRGEQIVHDALLEIAAKSSSVFFVQVGANDGLCNDPVSGFVHRYGWSGLVVEPVPEYFAELRRNYKDCEIRFENVAVSERREKRNFYYLSNTDGRLPGWAKGIGSFYRENVLSMRSEIPGFERRLVEVELECVPLMEILERNEVTRVDALVIDAEGYDGKILAQVDFSKVTPRLIIFEHKVLERSELDACLQRLRDAGYSFRLDAYDVVARHGGA